jgi:hypothetical protein
VCFAVRKLGVASPLLSLRKLFKAAAPEFKAAWETASGPLDCPQRKSLGLLTQVMRPGGSVARRSSFPPSAPNGFNYYTPPSVTAVTVQTMEQLAAATIAPHTQINRIGVDKGWVPVPKDFGGLVGGGTIAEAKPVRAAAGRPRPRSPRAPPRRGGAPKQQSTLTQGPRWEAVQSRSTGEMYCRNKVNGQTTWERSDTDLPDVPQRGVPQRGVPQYTEPVPEDVTTTAMIEPKTLAEELEQAKPGAASIFKWADANGDGHLSTDEVIAVGEFLSTKGLGHGFGTESSALGCGSCIQHGFSAKRFEGSPIDLVRMLPEEVLFDTSEWKSKFRPCGPIASPGITAKQFAALVKAAEVNFQENQSDAQKLWGLALAEASKGGTVRVISDDERLRGAKEGTEAIFKWADADDDGYITPSNVEAALEFAATATGKDPPFDRIRRMRPPERMSFSDVVKALPMLDGIFAKDWQGIQTMWDACVVEAAKGGKCPAKPKPRSMEQLEAELAGMRRRQQELEQAATEPEPQAELEPEQLLLALTKWAAKSAEGLDRAACTRLFILLSFDLGASGEISEREWQGLCEQLGADASEGLGLQTIDAQLTDGKIARWVVAHPRAAEYEPLFVAASAAREMEERLKAERKARTGLNQRRSL